MGVNSIELIPIFNSVELAPIANSVEVTLVPLRNTGSGFIAHNMPQEQEEGVEIAPHD